MSLYSDVIAASNRRETKAEIVSYFKERYPKGWQAKLINALHPFTSVKNAHNLARRFNPDRINKPGSKKEQEEYRQLGQMLPPIAPENGFHIWGIVWLKMSDGQCEERDVDEWVNGPQAQRLVHMASDEMAQAIVNHYMSEDIESESNEPSAVIGDCQAPHLHVEAA